MDKFASIKLIYELATKDNVGNMTNISSIPKYSKNIFKYFSTYEMSPFYY